jgi:hypothetical protein
VHVRVTFCATAELLRADSCNGSAVVALQTLLPMPGSLKEKGALWLARMVLLECEWWVPYVVTRVMTVIGFMIVTASMTTNCFSDSDSFF